MRKIDSIQHLCFTISVILCVIGCSKSPSNDDDTKTEPLALTALVVTTDYQVGSYSTVDVSDLSVTTNIATIHQDAVCRYDKNIKIPFIISRLNADAVEIINPQNGWEIASEYSVGPGTNPQDIAAVSPDLAFVSRLNSDQMLMVHPSNGTELGTVNIGEYADPDGIPEAAWLLGLNGKIFALLGRLDQFQPTNFSTMLVMDGATGEIQDAIELSVANPVGKLRYNERLKRLILVESGSNDTINNGELNGIIEYFDPETSQLEGPVITEQQLGGDLVDAVVVSGEKGYAIIGKVDADDTASNSLVSFHPTEGKLLETLFISDGWDLSTLEITPDGSQLWVADRTKTAPGVRIFNTTTDVQITESPIDVGLPPFMICFVQPDAAGVDPDTNTGTEDTETGDTDNNFTGVWADIIVESPGAGPGITDSNNIINGVRGSASGSQDVFSLGYEEGVNNFITLRWSDRTVQNGPGNDFAIFENSFATGQGLFMDLIIVHLSQDGTTWVPFPHDYVNSDEATYSNVPQMWQGFAGILPTLYHEENNRVDPFNAEKAGGDHFDLDNLGDSPEAQSIKEDGFTFIKMVTAPSQINPDTGQNYVNDAASNGADIDGVYARYPADQ